jgi:hypothetical protein
VPSFVLTKLMGIDLLLPGYGRDIILTSNARTMRVVALQRAAT